MLACNKKNGEKECPMVAGENPVLSQSVCLEHLSYQIAKLFFGTKVAVLQV